MLKNLEDKFHNYCISENFEINKNQSKVIKKLQEFYEKNYKSFFKQFRTKI